MASPCIEHALVEHSNVKNVLIGIHIKVQTLTHNGGNNDLHHYSQSSYLLKKLDSTLHFRSLYINVCIILNESTN